MSRRRRLPPRCVQVLIATLGSFMAGPALAEERPIHLTVAPGKVGEICLPLQAGDRLAWRFQADPAADFNVHHHVGDQVVTPVQRQAVTGDRAELAIDRRNDWCLMWTAPPGQRLTVSGAWSVRKAGGR